MYTKRNVFLLTVTLMILIIGISAVSASNDTEQISDDNSVSLTSNINSNSLDISENTNNINSNKENIETSIDDEISKDKTLKTAEYIITDGNFGRYFKSDGTQNRIQENDTIILSGSFTDRVFIIDKAGITLTGTSDVELVGGQIVISEIADNVTVKNILITTTGYENAIRNEAMNTQIINNTVTIKNVDGVTEGITNFGSNVTIANNTVTAIGPSSMIDWNAGDRPGLANTLGIFTWGGDNVLIENNTVHSTQNELVYDYYGTIDGIEVKTGTNVTVNNNKVTVDGARFVYGINALDHIFYVNITNNNITVNSERYVAGVQIGNSAENCTISGNIISGVCYNDTIFTEDNEPLAFGIITTNMGGGSETINMTISDNVINLNASIISGMEIYQTIISNITNNVMNLTGNYSIGIAYAHSPNTTVTNNKIYTSGNSTIDINSIVEEIRPGNIGIRVQQNSDNATITNNEIYTIDDGDNAEGISVDGSTNITIKNNSIVANDAYGNDAITTTNGTVIIANNTSPLDNKNAAIKLITPEDADTNSFITLKALVTDNETNTPINGKLVFKINGITLKDTSGNPIKVNVINGTATLNYQLSGYSAKNYTINAIFGNNSYNKAETNKNITINKVSIIIDPMNLEAYAGQTILLNQTLKDNNGNILKGTVTIAVKINGKTITHVKATNGILLSNITIPDNISAKKTNLTLVIGESNKYNSVISNNNLTILKQDVVITITHITAKPGEEVTLVATIKTKVTDKYVTTGKYIFKKDGYSIPLDDKMTTKELTNGTSTWLYVVDNSELDGDYNITVVYSGNSMLNSARVTDKALTIKA